MSRLKVPYGTTTQLTTAVVQEREVVFDTTLDRLAYGDGSAAAGVPVAKLSEITTLPSTSNASAAEVTATGSTEGRSLADRFADWVSLIDYGGVVDGATNDRTSMLAADVVAAGDKVIFVPGGAGGDLYFGSSTAVNSAVFLAGPALASQNFFSTKIIVGLADKQWFSRTDRSSGAYTDTPTTYTIVSELAGHYQIHNNLGGYQQSYDTDSGGRTMIPANYLQATHGGYGDMTGWNGAIGISKHANAASATSWTGRNSVTLFGGQTGAITDSVNVYGLEFVMTDNGEDDVAALGAVLNFHREGVQNAAYRTPWLGIRIQAPLSTQSQDAGYQLANTWRVGLDFTAATFDSTTQAGIAMCQSQRIYLRAAASSAPTNWYAGDGNSLGAVYIADDGTSAFAANTTDSASVRGFALVGKRATPANFDTMQLAFVMADSGGNLTEFGRITTQIADVTNGSEDGAMFLGVMVNGTLTNKIYMNNSMFAPASAAGISMGGSSFPFGPIYFRPGSSVTPASNGDVVFEATSNTSFTIRHKGSDGTVRAGAVTLS